MILESISFDDYVNQLPVRVFVTYEYEFYDDIFDDDSYSTWDYHYKIESISIKNGGIFKYIKMEDLENPGMPSRKIEEYLKELLYILVRDKEYLHIHSD